MMPISCIYLNASENKLQLLVPLNSDVNHAIPKLRCRFN